MIYVSTSIDDPIVVQPRNLCVLEKGAEVTVIERYASTGDSHYFNNNLTEIVLQNSALLNHYRVQQESCNAYHLGNVFLAQHASSIYT